MKNLITRILSAFFLSILSALSLLFSAYAASEEQTGPGRDIIFVLDVSGSMTGTDPGYRLREELMQCTESFAGAGNRAGAVPFSDQLGEALPLTELTPEGLMTAETYLQGLSYTNGDTDIGLGVSQAVGMLEQDSDVSERDRRVILITDGIIDLPHAASEKQAEKDSLTNALSAAETARSSGIRIDTIGLGEEGEADENLLGYLADRTGGSFSAAMPGFRLAEILTALTGPDQSMTETKEVPETEQIRETEEAAAETEPETEAGGIYGAQTETETELLKEEAPAVIGRIDSQADLKGILPSLCRTKVNLHDLFDFEDGDDVFFYVQADDPELVTCLIQGDTLEISGCKNGTTEVRVTAERGTGSSGIAFRVGIDAALTAGRLLAGAAVLAGAIILIVGVVFTRGGSDLGMYGNLRYYVKQEGQKIFGVPSQNNVDLSGLGKTVRLSEIVRDPYLESADIGRVILKSTREGVLIESHSRGCVISDENRRPVRKLLLQKECRFRVTCATDAGTAELIAVYSSGLQQKPEEAEEEKTRLLV